MSARQLVLGESSCRAGLDRGFSLAEYWVVWNDVSVDHAALVE